MNEILNIIELCKQIETRLDHILEKKKIKKEISEKNIKQ